MKLCIFVIRFFLSLSIICSKSVDHIYCPNPNVLTGNSTYLINRDQTLSSLTSKGSDSIGFYNTSAGQGPDEVFGHFFCRGDVSIADCQSCVSSAAKEIVELCPAGVEATIVYNYCLLRYWNGSLDDNMDYVCNKQKMHDQTGFNTVLANSMRQAKDMAAKARSGEKKFAVTEVNYTSDTLYNLVECTPDLSTDACLQCLNIAISKMPGCCDGDQGGRVLLGSCNIRYEIFSFYNVTAPPEMPSASPPPLPVILPPPPPPSPTALFQSSAPQTTHTVGGASGWIIPTTPTLYSAWAANQTFAAGDVLVFNFANNQHDVEKVNKADYDACTATNAITTVTTSPASITINGTGAHYFICGFAGHCATGQKLTINVSAATVAPAPHPPSSSSPDPCASSSCVSKKNSLVPMVASIIGVIIFIAAVLATLSYMLIKRRRKQQGTIEGKKTKNEYEELKSKGRQFPYSKVVSMTSNFTTVLGEGGFGKVYHGSINGDEEVAVKMLSLSSKQGSNQFKAEVMVLLRVHHRNLITLVGFCEEGTNIGLIYEYMENGDIEKHISGSDRNAFVWERRLQVAIDAAQGLEYLHNGCKPPIVHRDIKPANILLNRKFQAKLADFGISRSFLREDQTHVTTFVAGSPGYLDPEYSVTERLTTKSDVFSFGVVLFRIITGRPAVLVVEDEITHISDWVRSLLENGDIKSVVDPCLEGGLDMNSMWKAVEIAMACTSPTSSNRPTMHQVVTDLNQCLAQETTRISEAMGSTEIMTCTTPLVR